MTALQLLAAFFTIIGVICYALLANFLSRQLYDPILRAMFIFFLIQAIVFGAFFVMEIVMNVSVIDPVYGIWRPAIFRSLQSVAALWLLWVLTHK